MRLPSNEKRGAKGSRAYLFHLALYVLGGLGLLPFELLHGLEAQTCDYEEEEEEEENQNDCETRERLLLINAHLGDTSPRGLLKREALLDVPLGEHCRAVREMWFDPIHARTC